MPTRRLPSRLRVPAMSMQRVPRSHSRSVVKDLRPARVRGFTVLELFVCIAIAGILAALILPAVLQSRAASQRLKCANNLKQIGMATQSYIDQWGEVPQTCPLFKLLPYVEQQALQTQLSPPWASVDLQAHVGTYYCPNDPLVGPYPRRGYFLASYPVNWGADFNHDSGLRNPGGNVLRKISWSAVTDGLSQTALFSEMLTQGVAPDPRQSASWIVDLGVAEPIRAIWWTAQQNWQSGDEASFADHCLVAANRISLTPPQIWLVNYSCVGSHGYVHITPPNSVGCQAAGGRLSAVAATSYHQGGVNTAMCDGSVRFVSSVIDSGVWRSVGTRAGGEVSEIP